MSVSREVAKRINYHGKTSNIMNAVKMHSLSTWGKMLSLGAILFGIIGFALTILVMVTPVIQSSDLATHYGRYSLGMYSIIIPPEGAPYQVLDVFGMLTIILGGLCFLCAVPGIVINTLTNNKYYIIPVAATFGSMILAIAISFSATMDASVINTGGLITWYREWDFDTSFTPPGIVLSFTTGGLITTVILGLDAAAVVGVVVAYTIKLIATTHNY